MSREGVTTVSMDSYTYSTASAGKLNRNHSTLTRRNKIVPQSSVDDVSSPEIDKEFIRWASEIEQISNTYNSYTSLAPDHLKQQPKDGFLYLFALNSVLHILLGLAYISLHMYLDYPKNAETFTRWPNGIYSSIPALAAGLIGVASVTNVLELHSEKMNCIFLLCSVLALVLSVGVLVMSPFGHVAINTDSDFTVEPFTVWSCLDWSLFIVAWLELVVAVWSIVLGSITVNMFCRIHIGGYVDVESDLTNSMICLGTAPTD